MSEGIRAFAPASIANLAVGYDIMGLAIHGPGDEVVVRKSNKPGVQIIEISGTEKELPLQAEQNTAGYSAICMLNEMPNVDFGIEMEIHKKMPFGSGMGSSAASAAAATIATNVLLDRHFNEQDLCRFAMLGEQIASGGIHGDNVIPSLLGGLILIRNNEPVDLIKLPVPSDLSVMLVHPDIEILTKEARGILSREVSLNSCIRQTANAAAFVSGLYENDFDLISRSLHDHIIEPQRSKLIPHFDILQKEALESGAMNFTISGAGPSMFSFCKGDEKAHKVGQRMKELLMAEGIDSTVYISGVNILGTHILDAE